MATTFAQQATTNYPRAEAFTIEVEELKTPAGVPTSNAYGSAAGEGATVVYSLEQLAQKLDQAAQQRQEHLANRQERATGSVNRAKLRSAESSSNLQQNTNELQQRIDQQLTAANEKRSSLLEERRQRSSRRNSYVKDVAERGRNGETNGTKDLLSSIEQSLSAAQENHEKRLGEVRNRVNQHNTRVQEVKQFKKEDVQLQNQQRLEDLEESILMANAKKEELLEERAGRAGSAYYRAKEIATCMREINKIETRRLSREIDNELRSAQYQKEDLERERQHRLQARDRHGEEVRLRRSSMASSNADGSAQNADDKDPHAFDESQPAEAISTNNAQE